MDGKTEAWRDQAHKLLVALAKDNTYIVSDMVDAVLVTRSQSVLRVAPALA